MIIPFFRTTHIPVPTVDDDLTSSSPSGWMDLIIGLGRDVLLPGTRFRIDRVGMGVGKSLTRLTREIVIMVSCAHRFLVDECSCVTGDVTILDVHALWRRSSGCHVEGS